MIDSRKWQDKGPGNRPGRTNGGGQQQQLDRFLQVYAVEAAKIEAHRKGHSVTEQNLADGSIKLTVQIGGAA